MHKIIAARLLKVSQKFCVVDMSLRIKIAVTHFDGVKEFEVGHAAIIPCGKLRKFVLYSVHAARTSRF